MGLGDSWHKVAVYFGIADDEADYDEDETLAPHEELERSYQERPNVRKLDGGRSRNEYDDIFAEEPRRRSQSAPVVRAIEPARPTRVEVHLVIPKNFNDAQQIADKFKVDVPVIINCRARKQSSPSDSSTSVAASRTLLTGACRGWATRSSCLRRATSKSRPRNGRASLRRASSISSSSPTRL